MADKVRKRRKIKSGKRRRIFKSKRTRIMLACVAIAIFMCCPITFAWYGAKEREADSAPAEVMKPYYLNLRNPSDTANLQLSVGNLFPGDVKQIVFCVSNKNNEKEGLDMGVTSFEYSVELIHTENLALEYKIYELEKLEDANGGTGDVIEVLDVVDTAGGTKEHRSYFTLATGICLNGTDVSLQRHAQAGLVGNMPVNAGQYISYTQSSKTDESGNPKKLRLEANLQDGQPTFDSQYFLMEIDWVDEAENNFDKYEKETDMIYVLVEALQPKPEKKTR